MRLLLSIAFTLNLIASQAQNRLSSPFTMPADLNNDDYLHNTVILKVKEPYRNYCNGNRLNIYSLQKVFEALEVSAVSQKFPRHQKPSREYDGYGRNLVDLSLIYSIEFKSDIAIDKAINALLATGCLTYAEPVYIAKAAYNPNDQASQQSAYFNKIKLPEAWDIQKGDPSIVIGIIDTGTEVNHPDLKGNMYVNPGEIAGNGIDDDNNGYIDDVSGWDFGSGDNNPQWQGNDHGSHVTGIASAQTDNGIGIAGVGFKCKHVVAKGANSSGSLLAVYDGIPYLADLGVKVINCSWGVTAESAYNEDLVNYAVINKDVVVVAASGNEGLETKRWPAAYDNVMAVGATISSNDYRGSWSNYGYHIDVMAPGSSIYSTQASSYGTQSGTSSASPMVAGLAALVRAQFPSYNALQTVAQIRSTCDNIYTIGFNSSYVDKLGKGRINAYRALTETSNKSAGMVVPPSITDNNDNLFMGGDTLFISGDFTNYLAPLTALTATLSSTNSNITIIDGTTSLGAMNTMEKKKNTADPFKVILKSGIPLNENVLFKLNLTDGTYNDNLYFTIGVNVDYIDVNVNDVATSVTSKSLIGYNENGQKTGLGFNYNDKGTVLYEAGLMVGTSSSMVSDNIRSGKSTYDADFKSVTRAYKVATGSKADMEVKGTFNDNGSTSPLKITVDHTTYAFANSGHTKYVIFEYVIKNNNNASLSNLYAGIFTDWDIIPTILENKAETDATTKMGYSYCSSAGSMYAGIKLLHSSAAFNHYAADLVTGGGGGVNIPDGFSTAEKYTMLSTSRPASGNTATKGNDVASMVSTGPFNIAKGDSIKIAFAMLAGDDLADLKNVANTAQQDYDNIILNIEADQNSEHEIACIFPNPSTHEVTLTYYLPNATEVELSIVDAMGRTIIVTDKGDKNAGHHLVKADLASYPAGIYYYRLKTSFGTTAGKLVIVRN